jgi:chromate transporter
VLIVLVLAALYARYGDVEALSRILGGMASAAAGLLLAMVAKMMLPMVSKGSTFAPFVAVAAFVTVGLLQWPLPWVLAALVPISIGLALLNLSRGTHEGR